MANVAHSGLTSSNLHENKGVAAATAGQVATADGAGNTTWTKLTAANLQTTGGAFGMQLLHVRYSLANNSSGGTPVNLAWTKYPINTVVTNEIVSATLTSNVISLPAGTYHMEGSMTMAVNGGNSKLRLRNTTAGSTALVGRSSYVGGYDGTVPMIGRFTLGGTANLEIQYYLNCSGAESSGYMGNPTNLAGEVEVFSDFLIWKIL